MKSKKDVNNQKTRNMRSIRIFGLKNQKTFLPEPNERTEISCVKIIEPMKYTKTCDNLF